MGMGLGGLGRLGKLGIPAPSEGVGGLPDVRFFADGTDGWLINYAKTDQLFQDLASTPANDPSESIYLALDSHGWGGKTFADHLTSQPERATNGSFDTDTIWAKGSGWAITGGKAVKTPGTSTAIAETVSTTANVLYRVSGTISNRTAGSLTPRFTGGSTVNAPSVGANGQFAVYILAASGNNSLSFVASGTFDGSLDDVSMKAVSGNHAQQATGAAQPRWQTGGVGRYDGLDDTQGTLLLPATALTLMARFNASAPGIVIGGKSATGATGACYMGMNGSNKFGAGVGLNSWNAQTGGDTINGSMGVGVLTLDGTTVELWWNKTKIYSAAQSGAPDTTVALRLGASDTVAANFLTGDIAQALAAKKVATPTEIANITDQWSAL